MTLALRAGTDNIANDALSSKRSATKWPFMLINMQLSSSLAKARLSLDLRWRPREENVETDNLTNEEFAGFSETDRIPVTLSDMDLCIVETLWETKVQFDEARAEAKSMGRTIADGKKRKFDKSVW